jgi:hypothetical protein
VFFIAALPQNGQGNAAAGTVFNEHPVAQDVEWMLDAMFLMALNFVHNPVSTRTTANPRLFARTS